MESINRILAAVPVLAETNGRTVAPLEGGLTNENYLVTAGGNRYVLRIGGRGTAALGIDRAAEHAAHLSAAGISPEVIYADLLHDVMVTRFIDGITPTIEQMQSPRAIAHISGIIRQIHALPPNGSGYCPFAKARAWAEAARMHGAEFPADFDELAAEMCRVEAGRSCPSQPVLCHNDLVRGNLIEDAEGRLHVIDWEYAGVGEAMFDLAVVCMNSRYTPEHEDQLLKAYFGHFTTAHRADLRRFQLAFDYHMGIWYLLQSRVSALSVPFPRGAAHHFGRLRHHLKGFR